MDDREFLVKIKEGCEWKTKTKSVESIQFINGKYAVKYKSHSGSYCYGSKRVRYYDSPLVLDIESIIVEIKNKPSQEWDEIRIFSSYICFYRGNYCQVEPAENVKTYTNIANNSRVKKLREYYGYIVSLVREKANHLDYGYNKLLTSIRADSVLNTFADPRKPKKYQPYNQIFPFWNKPVSTGCCI